MSAPSWRDVLTGTLSQLKDRLTPAKIAAVGIGQELNGDDIAGISVVRKLKSHLGDQEHILLIDAGPAPENYTGPIRSFKPDLVILIDAAEMDDAPGTIRCLSLQDIDGLSASTHTLPLSLFASFLTSELDCKVLMIGIQPETTLLGAAPSPEVQFAVAVATQELKRQLKEFQIRLSRTK